MAEVNTLCNTVLQAPDDNVQEKILFNVVLILFGQCCKGKYSINVVLEAPGNNEQEKILFKVVLVLLGQHWKDKNLVQCCP